MKKMRAFIIAMIVFIINPPFIYAQEIVPDFYEVFDGHGSIMLLIDSQTGAIEYANRATADFYGYTTEELSQMNISDINILSREEAASEMQAAIQEKRNHFVFKHKLADGNIRTVEVWSYPYVTQGREMLFSIIYDITKETELVEKNKLINRLAFLGLILFVAFLVLLISLFYRNFKDYKRKSNVVNNYNQLRKTFIDADSRLIYLKDENLKYIFVNKAFEVFYKKELAEIVGKDDFALTSEKFAKLLVKTDAEVLQHKTPVVNEVKWKDKYYKINKFPVKLLNGHYGVGAYIEDVTDVVNSKKKEEMTLLRNSILVDVFSQTFQTSRDQLDYVLSKALELTESKYGYIYYYDEEKREFILNSWSEGVMAKCTITEKQTRYHLKETGIWGEVVRQRKPIVVNDFQAPHPLKKGYPQGHVPLTKFMSIPVIVENKIVAVIGLANKKEDYDDNDVYQTTVLMTGLWHAKEKRERELDLIKANNALKENQNKLELILHTAAEAIYGIDKKGRCTFCNASCVKMLGYHDQDDLIGKNMHEQIHHSRRDGTPIPVSECRIFKAFLAGERVHADDEVFWRSDGTYFDVEYFSYPQYKDGEIVGAVVSFMDITERKKAEQKIRYLSYHDSLTGLYNRAFFEEELKRLDTTRNYPISIIVGDVNGLKLTNDIFGHAAGDELLKRVASVLRKACRADDIIARVGGDEFVIILPKTDLKSAEEVVQRIKNDYAQEQVQAVKVSISLGCATKDNPGEDYLNVLHNAEDKMYLDKTLNRKNIDSSLIETIMGTLFENSPAEKIHSIRVSKLCETIGEALKLPAGEKKILKDIGYYHDIGKIAWDEKLLQKGGQLSEQEQQDLRQHPVVGYRILNSFENTMNLAESVLAHHERWDGSGYPKGLKGSEIPKLARILAIAESFVAMTQDRAMSEKEALEEIKKQAGFQFDPDIVNVFVKIMNDPLAEANFSANSLKNQLVR